ncbi:MAG: hypothetical protein ACRC8S_20290 [Fimbriiglobus sp.]
METVTPQHKTSDSAKTSVPWYRTVFIRHSVKLGVVMLGMASTAFVSQGCLLQEEAAMAAKSIDGFAEQLRGVKEAVLKFEPEVHQGNKTAAEFTAIIDKYPERFQGAVGVLIATKLRTHIDVTLGHTQGIGIELSRYAEIRLKAYLAKIIHVLDDSVKRLERERSSSRPSIDVVREVTDAIAKLEPEMAPYISGLAPSTLALRWDYEQNQAKLLEERTIYLHGWAMDSQDPKQSLNLGIFLVNRKDEARALPSESYTLAHAGNVRATVELNDKLSTHLKADDTKLRFVTGAGQPREIPLTYPTAAPPQANDEVITSIHVKLHSLGENDPRVADSAFECQLTAGPTVIVEDQVMVASLSTTQRLEPLSKRFQQFIGTRPVGGLHAKLEDKWKLIWHGHPGWVRFDLPQDATQFAEIVPSASESHELVVHAGSSGGFKERLLINSGTEIGLVVRRLEQVVIPSEYTLQVFAKTSTGRTIDLTAKIPQTTLKWKPAARNDVTKLSMKL